MPPPPVLPVSPEELEFFAEEDLIQIVPNCSVPGDYIDGVLERYGPFRPQQVVEVPVWLALQFHKRNKARIILPEWLSSKQLSESIEQERSSPDAFSQQPYYFMELACLLLEHAKACFASNDEYMQVRDKLANLVNVRRHKMEEGLHQIGSTATVRVNGLGAYELNLIRANFQGALNMFLKLETAEAAVAVPPPMSSTYGSTSFAS